MSEGASGVPAGFPLAPVTHMVMLARCDSSSLGADEPDQKDRRIVDPTPDPLATAYAASLLSTEDELVSAVRDPAVEQIDVRRVRLVMPEPEWPDHVVQPMDTPP